MMASGAADHRKFYSDYSTVFCTAGDARVYLLEEFVYNYICTNRITCECVFVVDLESKASLTNTTTTSADTVPSCFVNNPFIEVVPTELSEAIDFAPRNRD